MECLGEAIQAEEKLISTWMDFAFILRVCVLGGWGMMVLSILKYIFLPFLNFVGSLWLPNRVDGTFPMTYLACSLKFLGFADALINPQYVCARVTVHL